MMFPFHALSSAGGIYSAQRGIALSRDKVLWCMELLQVPCSTGELSLCLSVILSWEYGISCLEEATLPRHLSINGLLQILMFYNIDHRIIKVRKDLQDQKFYCCFFCLAVTHFQQWIPAWLFMCLLILRRANKFHKNYVSQGGIIANPKKLIARAGNLSMWIEFYKKRCTNCNMCSSWQRLLRR